MRHYLYINGATSRAEVLTVLNDGHAITHGPYLVVRVAEFDEAANSGAFNAGIVAGHRGGTVNAQPDGHIRPVNVATQVHG